jgi:signal transduction histidine kinase
VLLRDLDLPGSSLRSAFLTRHGVVCGAVVPIGSSGELRGALGAYSRTQRQFTYEDVAFLATIASMLSQASERDRSARAIEAALEELRESNTLLRKANDERRKLLDRLIRAEEDERQRIANDIHDDSVQVISSLVIRLGTLRRRIDDPELTKMLDTAEGNATEAVARLRRLMFELRPVALDRNGLGAALRNYLEGTRLERDNAFELIEEMDDEPDPQSRAILYRLAKEALTNVFKHADAEHVVVELRRTDGGTRVTVRDDGRGFVPEETEEEPGHLGLASMRERAELSGGWWKVVSAQGDGTSVEFFVPDSEPAKVPVAPG